MIPSFSFRTVKLLRYVTPFDYFVMACEWIFAFFVLYYIVEEVRATELKCGAPNWEMDLGLPLSFESMMPMVMIA